MKRVVLALCVWLAACGARAPEASAQPPKAPALAVASGDAGVPHGPLSRVADLSLVCMVNDQFMGVPQIPVPVAEHTYYGCCEMCQARLQKDAAIRTGVDPVSKRAVDKALAVLGRDGADKIYYFESEDTLAAFNRAAR